MIEDQLYIHVHVSVIYNPCVTRLTDIFYGVILTPKQTIRIIINRSSLPIIIEKDYNYNAIPTVLSLGRRESAFGPRKRVG